jgi:hypothetical protein
MFRSIRNQRQLLILGLTIVVVLASNVALPSAHAQSAPSWQALSIEVDFPNQQPRVIQTTYYGSDLPTPHVISSSSVDVTANCTTIGTLTYSGDYAIFNGSSYIQCGLASWRSNLALLAPGLPGAKNDKLTCDALSGPIFGAADVKLDPVTAQNPIIDASDLGIIFSLPATGNKARSQLKLSSRTYTSPTWNRNVNGNHTLIGIDGPAIIATDTYFGWLDILTSNWEPFFQTVSGSTIGQMVESPLATWTAPTIPYVLKTTASTIYIGYSPSTGSYLRGKLRNGQIDPGCFAG